MCWDFFIFDFVNLLMKYLLSFISILIFTNFQTKIKERDIEVFDKQRNRKIPVTLYLPKKIHNIPLVILNHGYNENKPNANKGYSFIGMELAAQGCMVASIQHELPTDELLPKSGDIQTVRKPFWDRGSDNILSVINHLKKRYPKLDFNQIILIGHSMGGDISVTFTKKHPELVYKLITLDHRRVTLPRVSTPRIYSLRSSDQIADEGVLPSKEEQAKLGIVIVKLSNTIHNDMNDNATPVQKREMISWILSFLTD